MLVVQSTTYSGKQLEEGFIGYFSEHNFIGILTIDEGISPSDAEAIFTKFKTDLFASQIKSLSEFESTVTKLIVKNNFPAHFNLAMGYMLHDALYVKTVGNGQVYFRRGKEFDLLMDGDKSASGYVQEYDMALLTTSKIRDLIGEVEDIKVFTDLEPPKEIVEKMRIEGYEEDAKGFIALFAEFLTQEAAAVMPAEPEIVPEPVQADSAMVLETVVEEPDVETKSEFSGSNVEPVSPNGVMPPVVNPMPAIPTTPVTPVEPVAPVESVAPVTTESPEAVIPTTPPHINTPDSPKKGFSMPFFSNLQLKQSKKISLIIVAVLFVILLWSVVFGYQRRMAAQQQEKIETAKEEIQAMLLEAEEEAYLDFDKSLGLIEESKLQFSALKEELGETKPDQIAEIETLINEAESKIVKRDEKAGEEFFDLALEAEDAQGVDLYFEDTNAAILDKKNSTVYVFSVDQKSLDKYTSPEVAAASLVGMYNGTVFFLNSKGIYEFTSNTKTELVIPEDNWGSITDFDIYNGNMYLLDEEEDEIYKYLVAEEGYSDTNSYFLSGQAVDLADSVGMSIDSAIYIAENSEVLKYVAGTAATFVTEYPETTPQLAGVYTNADIEQVYVWDNKVGALYELDKEGEYQRQLASSVFRKAVGVFVYEDNAYVFDGRKLYTISLN